MYKYALEKLKKDLEEQQSLKNRNNEELKQITEKLESIEDYNELLYTQFYEKYTITILLVIGALCGGCSLLFLIALIKITVKSGLALGLVTFGIFAFLFKGIKNIRSRTKKINELKKQGKALQKQQKDLAEKELELEEENFKIQYKMNKIIKILEHIHFVKETANNIFYQADTQEEYENAMKQNCLLMWNEFLNEKIGYSRIQLDSNKEEIVQIRKLTK